MCTPKRSLNLRGMILIKGTLILKKKELVKKYSPSFFASFGNAKFSALHERIALKSRKPISRNILLQTIPRGERSPVTWVAPKENFNQGLSKYSKFIFFTFKPSDSVQRPELRTDRVKIFQIRGSGVTIIAPFPKYYTFLQTARNV